MDGTDRWYLGLLLYRRPVRARRGRSSDADTERCAITGTDPHGGDYSGAYTVDAYGKLSAQIRVRGYDSDAEPILPGVSFPFDLEVEADYRSPDFFSARGSVEGHELVVNCRRK